MATHETDKIRNIAFVGEGGYGKTSLVEACLFTAGSTDRQGKVDAGNTILDSEPEEVKRNSSILGAVAYANWNRHRLNLLDTPGYSNFISDTVAAIRSSDNAVVVLNAHSEPKVITEKVLGWAEEEGLCTFIYLNQMDHEQADLSRAMEYAVKTVNKRLVVLQLPMNPGAGFNGVVDLISGKAYTYEVEGNGKGEESEIPAELVDTYEEYRGQLIEFAAEANEEVLEKYLEGEDLSPDEIVQGLRQGIQEGSFTPVLCGCGLKNVGTDLLLQAIEQFGATPSAHEFKAKNSNGEEVIIKADSVEPFRALVFKTVVDAFAGKLNYLRVVSGEVSSDTGVINTTQSEKERIGSLLFIQGKGQSPVSDRLVPGDIAALAKLKTTKTGDTLCGEAGAVVFEPINFPLPVISYAVAPKSKGDEEKLSTALARLRDEDPALTISRDPQTKEMLLSGLGVLHIEVIVERIKRKYGVEVEMQTPRVPYKETIKGRTKVQGRYKKQTGGRGQFGDTWLEIEPLQRGGGFEFVDKIVGGAIPKTFIPAVEKGIVEAMDSGTLAGYPVTDLKITLYDGSFHNVDSSEMAFKIAGSLGFKKGVQECRPTLLEPIMNMQIVVPEEYMGDIIGDMNSRRGRVLGMDPGVGGKQVIKSQVPMAEVLNYAPALRSLTADRGDFSVEFSHYEEVPGQISEKIISEAAAARESE
ncbi:MAG: elongation factor G [Nitrospinae bacterium]|nr:elongation factor G [Nitrospinota bacterium]